MKITKTTLGVLIVVLILAVTTTTIALAGGIPLGQKSKVQDVLDKAIEDGVLTQEDVDEFLNERMPFGFPKSGEFGNFEDFELPEMPEGFEFGGRFTIGNPIEKAVEEGLLTQAQADILSEVFQNGKMPICMTSFSSDGEYSIGFAFRSEEETENFKAALAEAVDGGKLTQEEADGLLAMITETPDMKFGFTPSFGGYNFDMPDLESFQEAFEAARENIFSFFDSGNFDSAKSVTTVNPGKEI